MKKLIVSLICLTILISGCGNSNDLSSSSTSSSINNNSDEKVETVEDDTAKEENNSDVSTYNEKYGEYMDNDMEMLTYDFYTYDSGTDGEFTFLNNTDFTVSDFRIEYELNTESGTTNTITNYSGLCRIQPGQCITLHLSSELTDITTFNMVSYEYTKDNGTQIKKNYDYSQGDRKIKPKEFENSWINKEPTLSGEKSGLTQKSITVDLNESGVPEIHALIRNDSEIDYSPIYLAVQRINEKGNIESVDHWGGVDFEKGTEIEISATLDDFFEDNWHEAQECPEYYLVDGIWYKDSDEILHFVGFDNISKAISNQDFVKTEEQKDTESDTTKAFKTATTIKRDQMTQGQLGIWEYDGVQFVTEDCDWLDSSLNTEGTINQGAFYRKQAYLLEGASAGMTSYKKIAERIIGFIPETEEEWNTYYDDLKNYIVTSDSLTAIMKKFESLNSVEGTFDYDNKEYSISIPDLRACAKEMSITEEMLGWTLADLEEYGVDSMISDNSYDMKLGSISSQSENEESDSDENLDDNNYEYFSEFSKAPTPTSCLEGVTTRGEPQNLAGAMTYGYTISGNANETFEKYKTILFDIDGIQKDYGKNNGEFAIKDGSKTLLVMLYIGGGNDGSDVMFVSIFNA